MIKKLVGLALASALAFGAVSAHAADEMTGYLSKGKVSEVVPFGEVVDNHYHKGIDLVFEDETVYTPINGVVEKLVTYDDNLTLVIITNDNVKDSIVLANLKECNLKEGQTVKVGDVIGESGSNAIHVEYWPAGYDNGLPANPRPFLALNGTKFDH